MKHIIQPKTLKQWIVTNQTVVVDCRFYLGEPDTGIKEYKEVHIPGAVYFDLEKDLSSKVKETGGRHPLPDTKRLADKLGRAGIDEKKTVVAYDSQGGAMAARFWWLLKYLGHRDVYVLDGGWQAWQSEGYMTSTEQPVPKETRFIPEPNTDMIVSADDVKDRDKNAVLVDSRAPSRYRGEEEPMDTKAGHIPGAINLFWKENISDGRILAEDDLMRRFESLSHKKDVMVYCGSGVTACANLLALSEAGIGHAKLYPGSWSDWISDDNRPIETE